jgi:hypothetical protein
VIEDFHETLDVINKAIEAEIKSVGIDQFTGLDAFEIAMASSGFKYIGTGRQRSVFRLGDDVVKIPRNEWGLASNTREASVSDRAFGISDDGELCGVRYARAVMRGTLLIMDYLKLVPKISKLPDWASWIDCQQVGIDQKGKLAAYDYGY